MNDESLLSLYAELKALADRLERALTRLSTLLPPRELVLPADPDRAPVFRQGEKSIRRDDLLTAVKADLERAVNLGLPVDPRLASAIDTQTNASLYGAGVELRHRLRAHEALTGSNEPPPPKLDLEAEAAPGMSAQARGA